MTAESLIAVLQDLIDQRGEDLDIAAIDPEDSDFPAFEIRGVREEGHVDLDGNYYDVVLEIDRVSDGLQVLNRDRDEKEFDEDSSFE